MDRIPERLRTAADGVAKATQMMADAKSERNGDGACYQGLKAEQTAEWQGAALIEKYEKALREIYDGFGPNHHSLFCKRTAEAALESNQQLLSKEQK